MLDAILGRIQSLKLSLTEWLAVTAAIVIGGLVAALKVQGSRLHAAQVRLAGASRDARASKDDEAVFTADQYYQKVRAEYLKNGGKFDAN